MAGVLLRRHGNAGDHENEKCDEDPDVQDSLPRQLPALSRQLPEIEATSEAEAER